MTILSKRHPVKRVRFRNLLFVLILYVMGTPFLQPYPSLMILAHISLSIVLFVAVYAVHRHKKQRSIGFALLLPFLFLYWLGLYDVISFSRLVSQLLLTAYYGLLVYSFAFQISNERRVNTNVLYATFSLYLIIGLFWGTLYTLLDTVSPGSYSGVLLENAENTVHVFNYFSFVTLTTLGYGDITPQSPGAAALCQMEAIIGQFFTAVVVAWLMGMWLSEKQGK